MARRTSRFDPSGLIGLMPTPAPARMELTPSSFFRKAMSFSASGLPPFHSMPE